MDYSTTLIQYSTRTKQAITTHITKTLFCTVRQQIIRETPCSNRFMEIHFQWMQTEKLSITQGNTVSQLCGLFYIMDIVYHKKIRIYSADKHYSITINVTKIMLSDPDNVFLFSAKLITYWGRSKISTNYEPRRSRNRVTEFRVIRYRSGEKWNIIR